LRMILYGEGETGKSWVSQMGIEAINARRVKHLLVKAAYTEVVAWEFITYSNNFKFSNAFSDSENVNFSDQLSVEWGGGNTVVHKHPQLPL
jgi:hypothetical protein